MSIVPELPAAVFSPADEAFMQRALSLAAQGAVFGEVPVGAVLVSAEGEVLGEGYNQPILAHDATAHAEVVALRQAGLRLANYRLQDGVTLYVTLEPCTMCVGALIHARVARVVFAATEPKAGSLVSARQLLDSGYYNHQFVFAGGLLAAESGSLLSAFFRARREAARQTRLAADQP